MGMLATVMNCLAMRDALERANISASVMSSIPMSGIVEHYDRRRAIRYLDQGDVVLFAAGTGTPSLQPIPPPVTGIEIDADVVMKATKVDGVYTADPVLDSTAELLPALTYDEVLERDLGVMDLTAICLCRDHGMPLRVFNMGKVGVLLKLMLGEEDGTLIQGDAVIDEIKDDTETRMEKSVAALKRPSHASAPGEPALRSLDDIKIDYYGTPTPLTRWPA